MAEPGDELVALYQAAARRLRAQIRAALARDAIGTAAYREQQLAAVRAQLRALEAASPAAARRAILESYLEGATVVTQTIGAPPLEPNAVGRFYGVHEAAVSRYFGRLDERLQLARGTLGRQAQDLFARVGREQTALGIATGAARREVSARIVEDLVRDGVTGFIDRNGRRWPLDSYAEMVARTTTREAVSQGTANRMLELGRDLVTISTHANSCPICLPYQGKTFSLTGASRGYPIADRLPPFHPRCRHVVTPAGIDPPDPATATRDYEEALERERQRLEEIAERRLERAT